jgi:hypothetical protein
MIRHLVLLDASEICKRDTFMRDILLSMGYGMYPMCVQFNETTNSLIFRRGFLSSEKDKAQRLATAADELQKLDAVQWFHAQTADTKSSTEETLHVHGPTVSVSWPLAPHSAATHARMIPDLLMWTNWEHTNAWKNMLQATSGRLREERPPRHVRFAQALDDAVQNRRMASAGSDAAASHTELLALCQQTLQRLQSNEVDVVVDPATM